MPLTSTLEKTPPPLPGQTVDNTLPTVGGNLAVVTDSETSSGFSLSWDKGSDNQTAEENLKYLVYISDQDNITGVSNAENNGTLLNPDEADQLDINTFLVSGQNSETQYWATVILKDQGGNKNAYGVVTTTTAVAGSDGLDSKAGDEAALEKLYTETNGAGWTTSTGWASSGMDLSNSIHGVTTETIGGGLRVTEIDLRGNNLTGQIDFTEWQNLKQMNLVCLYFNSINSDYPNSIHNCTSLEYLYLCLADANWDPSNNFPHEAARQFRGAVDPGKSKSVEQNRFHGTINSDIDNLPLKYIALSWTDHWVDTSNKAVPEIVDGIQNVPSSLWNIPTLEAIMMYENWNIAASGNTFSYPASVAHMVNLEIMQLGGGSGSGWDAVEQGFMTGGYPSDMDQMSSFRVHWVQGHSQLQGFPDYSNSPNIVVLVMTGSNFSGPLPEWLVDGTIENGNDDVAWQHFDSLSLSGPHGWQFNGSDLAVEGAGLSGPLPTGFPWRIEHVDHWNVKLNSLEGPIPASFWNNNIRKVDWSFNLITSLGTQDLTGMTQTEQFVWKYCRIGPENIPYLDWNDQAAINWAWMQGNYYTFANFLWEPPNGGGQTAFDLWDAAASDFRYSPQRNFGSSNTYNPTVGTDVTLDDFQGILTHANNQYQWEKDGNPITGETSQTLTISNIQTSDAGTYVLTATNPGVPGLTLESAPITINFE